MIWNWLKKQLKPDVEVYRSGNSYITGIIYYSYSKERCYFWCSVRGVYAEYVRTMNKLCANMNQSIIDNWQYEDTEQIVLNLKTYPESLNRE